MRVGTIRFGLIAAAAMLLTAAHPGEHEAATPAKSSIPAAPADATTPADAVAAFHAALTRGDKAAALALMLEDALIFESGGVERSRAEYAAHHLAADAEFSAAVQRKLVDRSVFENGDVACVTTIETVTGAFRARPVNSRSLETMALRRTGGSWKIAHIHWSSAKLPQSR